MGTVLHAAGYPLDRALPELNLSDPALVRRIHDSYLASGVGLVQTNTFGAGPLRLEAHGLADRTEQVNAAGVRVAREAAAAAGGAVLVAGSVGPAVTVQQRRRVSAADRRGRAAGAGAGPGRGRAWTCWCWRRSATSTSWSRRPAWRWTWPGRAGWRCWPRPPSPPTGAPWAGTPRRRCARRCAGCRWPRSAPTARWARRACSRWCRSCARTPTCRCPRCPTPACPGGAAERPARPVFSYGVDEQYFARYAQLLVAAGAALVGGCCGTTPAHLDAMVRAVAAGRRGPGADAGPAGRAAAARRLRPRAGFRVLAEIEPPQAGHVEAAMTHGPA